MRTSLRAGRNALLLTSELVSNALRHGSRDSDEIELVWRLEHDSVEVAVLDAARAGGSPIALTPNEERAEGGVPAQPGAGHGERIIDGRREVSFQLQL